MVPHKLFVELFSKKFPQKSFTLKEKFREKYNLIPPTPGPRVMSPNPTTIYLNYSETKFQTSSDLLFDFLNFWNNVQLEQRMPILTKTQYSNETKIDIEKGGFKLTKT